MGLNKCQKRTIYWKQQVFYQKRTGIKLRNTPLYLVIILLQKELIQKQ